MWNSNTNLLKILKYVLIIEHQRESTEYEKSKSYKTVIKSVYNF